MPDLADRLEMLPAKLPELTFPLQADVNIRQIMHHCGLIQAANPSKAPDSPAACHGGYREAEKLCTPAHYCQSTGA